MNATEVIETAEPPVMAIRRKKDSSIVVAMNLVKRGEQMHLYLREVLVRYWSEAGDCRAH